MMPEEDYLLISGIQHFVFCKRQWALIYLENIWKENIFTVQGKILHEKVDDPEIIETRGSVFLSRSMPIVSHNLKVSGIADLVEFEKTVEGDGVYISSRKHYYLITPVEYKRGKPKQNESDAMQLCAQAICLEEMFNTHIEFGYVYYNEIRHRQKIFFSQCLREDLKKVIIEMQEMFRDKKTPICKKGEFCSRCSIYDYCIPDIFGKNVDEYIYKKIIP